MYTCLDQQEAYLPRILLGEASFACEAPFEILVVVDFNTLPALMVKL